MPMPVKSSCRTRSMRGAGSVRAKDLRKGRFCSPKAFRPPRMEEAESAGLIGEFDVLVEGDGALVVLHDVVAVKHVAVLVEIVFALGAREFLDRQDRLADLRWIDRAGLVDRS